VLFSPLVTYAMTLHHSLSAIFQELNGTASFIKCNISRAQSSAMFAIHYFTTKLDNHNS